MPDRIGESAGCQAPQRESAVFYSFLTSEDGSGEKTCRRKTDKNKMDER